MSSHQEEEAFNFIRLHKVFGKFSKRFLQGLNNARICFGHHLQDLLYNRPFKLLTQSTQDGCTLLPEDRLSQRPGPLEKNEKVVSGYHCVYLMISSTRSFYLELTGNLFLGDISFVSAATLHVNAGLDPQSFTLRLCSSTVVHQTDSD